MFEYVFGNVGGGGTADARTARCDVPRQCAADFAPALPGRCRPSTLDPQVYRLLLGLVAEVTPVVQALPPSALVADVSGSLRYFDRDPSGLARMIRTRVTCRSEG